MSVWNRICELLPDDKSRKVTVARICEVRPSAITKWAKEGNISAANLAKLAIHFGVSVDWLLDLDQPSNRNAVPICPPPEAADKPQEKDKILHWPKTREEELSAIAEELQAVVSRLKRLTGGKM
jgi:transcriptional regulator with XRE-family HTH domain